MMGFICIALIMYLMHSVDARCECHANRSTCTFQFELFDYESLNPATQNLVLQNIQRTHDFKVVHSKLPNIELIYATSSQEIVCKQLASNFQEIICICNTMFCGRPGVCDSSTSVNARSSSHVPTTFATSSPTRSHNSFTTYPLTSKQTSKMNSTSSIQSSVHSSNSMSSVMTESSSTISQSAISFLSTGESSSHESVTTESSSSPQLTTYTPQQRSSVTTKPTSKMISTSFVLSSAYSSSTLSSVVTKSTSTTAENVSTTSVLLSSVGTPLSPASLVGTSQQTLRIVGISVVVLITMVACGILYVVCYKRYRIRQRAANRDMFWTSMIELDDIIAQTNPHTRSQEDDAVLTNHYCPRPHLPEYIRRSIQYQGDASDGSSNDQESGGDENEATQPIEMLDN